MRRQEWIRKLLHIPGGLVPPLAVLLFGWSGALAVAVFLLAYLLVAWEQGRRGRYLPIAWALVVETRREHEPEPVAASEFLVSTILLGLLFPLPYFFGAMAVLGVGDGMASLIGQTRGKHRLPWNGTKTWEGFAAGMVFGTLAYVGLAIVGGLMQGAGFAAGRRALPALPLWMVPLTLAAAYVVVHAVARYVTAHGWAARRANASGGTLLAAFAVAMAPCLAVLLTVPAFLDGPVLPTQGGHGPVTQGLLLLAPVVAMLVESVVRRHDNLWVPVTACTVAYGTVRALGGL